MDAGGSEYGEVLPLPIVSWLHEYGNYRRFTHMILLRLPAEIDRPTIEVMLQLLLDGHEMLRSILVDTADGPRLVTREPGAVRTADLITRMDVPADSDVHAAITAAARTGNDHIDPRAGAMAGGVDLGARDRGDAADRRPPLDRGRGLLAHHARRYHRGVARDAIRNDTKDTAGVHFLPAVVRAMWRRAGEQEVQSQRPYWADQVRGPDPALGSRLVDPTRDTWSTLQITQVLAPVDVTECVLATFTRNEGMDEFLLSVLTMTIASWRRSRDQDPSSGTLVALEGHGRADALLDTDTTNTVGWFTTAFPVRLAPVARRSTSSVARAIPVRSAACSIPWQAI